MAGRFESLWCVANQGICATKLLAADRKLDLVRGLDRNPAHARLFGLRNPERQDAVVETRLGTAAIDLHRQGDRLGKLAGADLAAIPGRAFRLALAERIAELAANRQRVLLDRQLDIFRLRARQYGLEDQFIALIIQIDRRSEDETRQGTRTYERIVQQPVHLAPNAIKVTHRIPSLHHVDKPPCD